MTLAIILGVLASLIALSIALPVWRRVWVFSLTAMKYLFLGLFEKLGLRRLVSKIRGRTHEPMTRPRGLRLFCEDMGPTFVKFGQIVASSSGLFPESYVEEFHRCLDRVRPFAFEQVVETIESELGAEGKRRIVEVEVAPLASASIAQVHRAKLEDGTEVVVKVQRPGIGKQIHADMKIMRVVARFVGVIRGRSRMVEPVAIVDDLAATLSEEIDFRLEASNLDRFNQIMRELEHHDVRAPVPHWALTTQKVLVMERFEGVRVDDVEALVEGEHDSEAMLVKGLRAWFQCVLFHGFFHGDVHAGNLMLLSSGDIGFLDFGIVGRFEDRERRLVTDYIVSFTVGDYTALAETIVAMGGVGDDVDRGAFATALEVAYEPMRTTNFGDLNLAEMIPKVQRIAREHGMMMPKEFVLIMKQMLYFDRYAKLLAPDLNIFTDPRLVMSLMLDIQKARA